MPLALEHWVHLREPCSLDPGCQGPAWLWGGADLSWLPSHFTLLCCHRSARRFSTASVNLSNVSPHFSREVCSTVSQSAKGRKDGQGST